MQKVFKTGKFIKEMTKLSKKYGIFICAGRKLLDIPVVYGKGKKKSTSFLNFTYDEEDKKYHLYQTLIPIAYEKYWTREKNGMLIKEYMHVEKITAYDEAQEYDYCIMRDNFQEFWDFIKDYIIEHNIKMTGYEHQSYGIPLVQYGDETYAFYLSCEMWGKLMSEAFDPSNTDENAYLSWAFTRPDGEVSWVNPDYENQHS
jgi:hypothetical protein